MKSGAEKLVLLDLRELYVFRNATKDPTWYMRKNERKNDNYTFTGQQMLEC
jgi:hypothetical protein